MFAAEFPAWWWLLGVAGAASALAVFVVPRYRDRASWRAAIEHVEGMQGDHLDSIGAAWIRPNYASAPLVRIGATRTELVIVGRWWWVPIQPTIVSRGASTLRRGGQVLYRKFILGDPEGRIWAKAAAAQKLEELGWVDDAN